MVKSKCPFCDAKESIEKIFKHKQEIANCKFCDCDDPTISVSIDNANFSPHIKVRVKCRYCEATGPACSNVEEAVLTWNKKGEVR